METERLPHPASLVWPNLALICIKKCKNVKKITILQNMYLNVPFLLHFKKATLPNHFYLCEQFRKWTNGNPDHEGELRRPFIS